MFGSFLPPVVCRSANVLFTLFADSVVLHILCCVVLRLCVPYVASLFGLSIFYCTFGIL